MTVFLRSSRWCGSVGTGEVADGTAPKDYNESKLYESQKILMKELFLLKSSLLCLDHAEYKNASVEYFFVYAP